jgi:hypothetical protein
MSWPAAARVLTATSPSAGLPLASHHADFQKQRPRSDPIDLRDLRPLRGKLRHRSGSAASSISTGVLTTRTGRPPSDPLRLSDDVAFANRVPRPKTKPERLVTILGLPAVHQ